MGINRGKAETILPELTVDVGDAGLIYVDSSNRTGFGVSDPDTKVEIFHAGNQLKLSYDSDSFATFGVADASHLTIATGENGNLILDAAGDIELNADGADIVFKDATHQLAKFTAGSATLVMGSGVAEDTMVLFDGNAQDFRIGLDDGTDTLEIGHGSSHGSNTALSVNSSGQITTFNIPAAAVAQASDHIIFLDGGATGAPKAESIDDFLTAIAGSGISVSSSQLTASAVSALNDLSDVSFSSGDLTITSLDTIATSASAHNAAGTGVVIKGGSTTAGTTNNIAGGSLTFEGGQGKGTGAGGDIVFKTANAGGSGSSLNSLATALTISDDLSSTFAGAIQANSTVTVGVDDTGYDVILFGATASANMTWDASEDDLILNGAARIVVPDGQLVLGSTAVGSTAAELNLLDGSAKSTSSITIADSDAFIVIDGTTTKQIPASDISTYVGGVTALNGLSDVSYSSGDLTITSLDLLTTSASAHDAAGTAVVIRGGNTTAGTTNDIAGGNLTLAGGQGKGGGAGGNIVFQVANAGGAGSSINSLATALTISDDKSAEFESTIQSRTSVTVLNTTTSSATQGGALILQADDGAAMAQDHRLGLIQFEGAEDASNSLTVGARIEALCDAGWSATENGTRMVFSTTDGNANVSEVLKLDSNKLATFAGAVTVTGDTTVANNLICGKFISHTGDTDTRIVFFDAGDIMALEAGGVEFARLSEGSQDEFVINDQSADIDFRVESDDETHMLFVDGDNNRISIGDSVDAPAATLEITNHATAGAFGVPLLQLNSNDTDQIGIDINAANVDADVIDITADAVTTANVIDVSADALTTGSILNLISDSSTTGDRALVSITNDHASAVNTQALLIKNDAIAAKSTVVFESTVAETNPLLELINSHDSADKPPMLRFNKLGNIADDVDIGHISFYAENSAGTPEAIEYAKILIEASDTTDAR
jgi:hypothetical protein